MSVVYRADGEPGRSRMEYWRQALAETLGPLEPHGGTPDRLTTRDLGAVRIGEIVASEPGGARRTVRHVAQAEADLCKIDVLVRGSGVVAQAGREAELRAGDLVFVDLSRPAYWSMAPARIAGVVFPRALLPFRAEEQAALTAVRIPGDEGSGALVSSLARQLIDRLAEPDPAEATRLGTAVLELFTVAMAARLDRPAPARSLLQHIHAYIERRLGDPALTPQAIAAVHHVSLRYLYKLFEAEGHSVAGWIRQRRLERCRRDLRDPALRSRPVGAIGARWGFPSPAHFSRAFRAVHGVPPAEYRAIAATGPQQPPQ